MNRPVGRSAWPENERARLRTVRDQVGLLEEIRDRMMGWPMADRERWVKALMPLTRKALNELHCLEGTAEGLGYVIAAGYAPGFEEPRESEKEVATP